MHSFKACDTQPARFSSTRQRNVVFLGGGSEQLDTAVRRSTVGYEQLYVSFEVLPAYVGNEMLDVRRLVEHRSDDRDSLDWGPRDHDPSLVSAQVRDPPARRAVVILERRKGRLTLGERGAAG